MKPISSPSQSETLSTTSRVRLERLSEPWAISKVVAVVGTLLMAVIFASWAANGQLENLILTGVWMGAVMIIIFVHDYWWSPMLVIISLSCATYVLGFPLSGMEVGVVILALTFPIKMAMKTLRKAEPELRPGLWFWLLLGFLLTHVVTIILYNKFIATPQIKNIVKAYYTCITPLVLYGLLVRYGHTRTVRPTVNVLFGTTLFATCVSILTTLTGISVEPFSDLRISVGWLDPLGAVAILRSAAPNLFIGCLAFFPVVKSPRGRFLVTFGIIASGLGTALSGGRLALVNCVLGAVFFAFVRRKLWLVLPAVLIMVSVSAAITAMPDFYLSLPNLVQRSLAPINFSNTGADTNEVLAGSDDWHKELRERSMPYWFEDTTSFWIGHGYKSWDPELRRDTDMTGVDEDHLAELAVEMGITENMFSSITNIFGMVGLLLYGAFAVHVGWLLYRGIAIAPPGSDTRAMCEFSLIRLVLDMSLAWWAGGVPGLILVYWALGIVAARPYLAAGEPEKPKRDTIPAFARPALETTAGRRMRTAGQSPAA